MEHQQRKELFAASDAALVLEDDRRHVNRLQKPPLSPIHIHEQHVSGPEDDDDFIIDRDVLGPIGKKRDSNNNNTQLTLPAASVTQHHHHPLPPPPALSQPRTRLYPWLDEHSSKRIDQQRETNVIRSEPTRHGYNTTSANPTSTDHSNVNTSEHQSVRTRLLPPSRPSTGHDFWRAVTNPGTITATTAAYGSSSNNSRRHSILRFGSKRRPQNERNMKKSASVEFKLHDGAHLLKHASSDAKPFSGLTLGRDMPRRLTEEEKEELYRIRPDLEIGPTPFFKEQMAELQQRNQKRVLFAMFGGILSIVLLLVFYALLARG